MRMLNRLLLGLIIFGFGAHAASSQEGAPVYGGTLTVALDNDAKSLDPVFQRNFSERQVMYLVFNTLFALQKDFSIAPELAEKWSFSPDGKQLDITVRQGVKFHDGTDLDAEAVKWNLDYRMDEATKSISRSLLTDQIASVEVTGKYNVRLLLKSRSPNLLGMLAQREGFILSPTAAKSLGDKFGSNPVGSGPFRFREWTFGNRIVVEKNPDYWEKGKPYLDRIVMIQTASPTVGIPRLLTGEIQAVGGLSPTDVRPLTGNKDIRLIPSPGGRWISLHMRNDTKPFDDLRVRQALSYAIDRKKIVDVLQGGRAIIANGPTPPGLWWSPSNLPTYDRNLQKARELLKEAGYANGLNLTLSAAPSAILQQIVQLSKEQFEEAGINVELKTVSTNDWLPLLIEKKVNFLPIRWTQRPDADGLLTQLFHSKGPQNESGYNNPAFDKMIEDARAEGDQQKRKEIYQRAQEQIVKDAVYVDLFYAVEYMAVRNDVRNFEWIPDEVARYRDVWKAAK